MIQVGQCFCNYFFLVPTDLDAKVRQVLRIHNGRVHYQEYHLDHLEQGKQVLVTRTGHCLVRTLETWCLLSERNARKLVPSLPMIPPLQVARNTFSQAARLRFVHIDIRLGKKK